MEIIEEIKNWKGKPKELIIYLTEEINTNNTLFPQIINLLQNGTKVQKGTSADIIEEVSLSNPELVAPYISNLIEHINDDLPSVKWGIPQAIGNLSKKYPSETEKAMHFYAVDEIHWGHNV